MVIPEGFEIWGLKYIKWTLHKLLHRPPAPSPPLSGIWGPVKGPASSKRWVLGRFSSHSGSHVWPATAAEQRPPASTWGRRWGCAIT